MIKTLKILIKWLHSKNRFYVACLFENKHISFLKKASMALHIAVSHFLWTRGVCLVMFREKFILKMEWQVCLTKYIPSSFSGFVG